MAVIRDPKLKEQIKERLRTSLDIDSTKDDTAQIEEGWRKCEQESAKVPQAEFEKKHADFLRNLVCDAKESRQAIAKGIIRKWISDTLFSRINNRFAFEAQLARGLLGEDGKPCAATQDLDEADVKKLRAAIAAAPTPPTPTAPTPSPPVAVAPVSPPAVAPAPASAASAPVAAPAARAAPAPAQSPPK